MLTKKITAVVTLGIFLLNPLHAAMAASAKKAQPHPFASNSDSASSNELSISALWLRADGSNDYGTLVSPLNPNVADPALEPSWQPESINPKFSPGFSVNFRHTFADTENDINLYWADLHTSDGASMPVNTTPALDQMTGPSWNIGPEAVPTKIGSGQLKNDYDVANIEFGKQIHSSCNLKGRWFSGVSALWLQQKNTGNFAGTSSDPLFGAYTFGMTTTSKYRAAGLRLGVDGEYQPQEHFGIVGLFAGNLYVGSQQPNTSITGTGVFNATAGIPVGTQSIQHDSYMDIVPAIDAKLGLKYSRDYSNTMSLSLEAGYMASIYINAIQNYVPSTLVPGTHGITSGSIYLQSLLKSTNSFALDGPYLTLTVKMA